MSTNNIKTRTASFTTSYTTLVENSRSSLVVIAGEDAVFLCTGVALGSATDALAIRIPAGTGVVLEPAPQGPVHLRLDVAGPISYWYA